MNHRCAPHGAYACERCIGPHDLMTAPIAVEPLLPTVEILRPEPGDTLVVSFDQAITMHQAAYAEEQIRQRTELPDNIRILVLSRAKASIVRGAQC